ncbi:MAG: mechanosensitive ion channel family protein [Verrucomicrobiota bacterium]|jgi:small-conductance mechanosensitive channel
MTDDFWIILWDLFNPRTFVGAAMLAVVIGLLAWVMGEAVRLIVQKVLEKPGPAAEQAGVLFLGQLARAGVWFIAFVSYANLVPKVEEFLDPSTLPGAAFAAVVALVLAWLVGRALRLTVHRVLEKRGKSIDQTAVSFLGQLARVLVWVFVFISYTRYIPALRVMNTTWLASVGVISVVVGMAAQNTLGNLIAGFSLVLYRPFQIGDHLQVTAPGGQETGVVESVNLGYTILRAGDQRRLVIPNSLMASQTCVNLSMSGPRAACVVALTLEHESDADKARQILLDIARKNPKSVEPPDCRISNLSRAGVTLTLTAWAASSLVAGDLKCDILEAAKTQFDASGIKIPRDYEIDPPGKDSP